MSVCSKNAKLGVPSTQATSAQQLPERAQLIDGAYYYEAIGTVNIPGSLSRLLCVTDKQLLTIYHCCGFYNVKRNCFSDTIIQGKEERQLVASLLQLCCCQEPDTTSTADTSPLSIKTTITPKFNTHTPVDKAALVMELVGEMKSPEKVMLVLFGFGNNNI
jgi:hypothetical protein